MARVLKPMARLLKPMARVLAAWLRHCQEHDSFRCE